MADRKSVVQGKSVDLGGRRIIKKKKKKQQKKKKTNKQTNKRGSQEQGVENNRGQKTA